jgi:hypothetical protein
VRSDINPIGVEQRKERTGVHRTTFHKVSSPTNANTFPLVEYGYKPDGKSIVPTSVLSGIDTAAQTLTLGSKSLITKATSRRMWKGSSPMRLSLLMRFEAVFDPLLEVLQPLRILGSLTLPVESSSETGSKLPFLGPPGPSPFQLQLQKSVRSAKLKEVASVVNSFQGGDQIQIELGEFLTFFSVIVREVNLTVPIRFDASGNPVSATVNVLFETYEMLTAESFRGSFKNNSVVRG